jgi:hypothetical protein
VTATVTRGRHRARASVRPRSGRWAIRVRLKSPLRHKGTNAIAVRYGGQATYAPATARRTLRIR